MSQLKNRKGKSPTKKMELPPIEVLLPWKPENPQITISKVTSNRVPDYIQIHINTKEQLHIFVRMTPHDFGVAITGLGFVPCDLTIE